MLIPANLRSPVLKASGTARDIKSLFAANLGAVTLGIACARAVPSVVEVNGVRAAAAANASCAVGVTRLELRGGRIFGVPCAGVGAVEQPTWVPPAAAIVQNTYFVYSTRVLPWVRPAPWINPMNAAADVVIEWTAGAQLYSNMPPGVYRIPVGSIAPGASVDIFAVVMEWLNVNLGYAAVYIEAGMLRATVPLSISPVTESHYATTSVLGAYGGRTFTNPFPVAASVTVNVVSLSEVFRFNVPVDGYQNGYPLSNYPAGYQLIGGSYTLKLAAGASFYTEAINRNIASWAPVDEFAVTVTFTPPSVIASPGYFIPAVPLWQTAPLRLEWATAGLPWWGVIEAAAKAGQWVRRLGWVAGRQVRYEAGVGTTRAVAVIADGSRVTTADFGIDEWGGDDWQIASDAEPPAIDVTDWIFTGPALAGSVLFKVGGGGGGTPPVLPPGPGTPELPGSGSGFVYMRDGETILVPAKDCEGREWTP